MRPCSNQPGGMLNFEVQRDSAMGLKNLVESVSVVLPSERVLSRPWARQCSRYDFLISFTIEIVKESSFRVGPMANTSSRECHAYKTSIPLAHLIPESTLSMLYSSTWILPNTQIVKQYSMNQIQLQSLYNCFSFVSSVVVSHLWPFQ